MPDFPNYYWPPLNVITPFHPESLGSAIRAVDAGLCTTAVGSGVFVDELIYYYPFRIYVPSIAVKMSYIVGATAAGNVDLGIYDAAKNKIISTGLTAQGTINTLQEFDITDTLLLPGNYFMAIKCTDGTGTRFAGTANDEFIQSLVPMYTEAGGAGAALPSVAAPIASVQAFCDFTVMGVHFDTLI